MGKSGDKAAVLPDLCPLHDQPTIYCDGFHGFHHERDSVDGFSTSHPQAHSPLDSPKCLNGRPARRGDRAGNFPPRSGFFHRKTLGARAYGQHVPPGAQVVQGDAMIGQSLGGSGKIP